MVGIILAYKQVNKLSPGGWSRGLFLSAREENAAKKELEHLGFVEVVYMAKHEFGIMLDAPKKGKHYDEYEPWKYTCISVDDDDLANIVERLSTIDFYWHTLSAKRKGLAYYGITLIPPDSLKAFIDVIADISELNELKKLLEQALDKNKWMIHYGI